MTEQQIEQALIEKLGELKYTYRPDIRDRAALEANFRQHFEALTISSRLRQYVHNSLHEVNQQR